MAHERDSRRADATVGGWRIRRVATFAASLLLAAGCAATGSGSAVPASVSPSVTAAISPVATPPPASATPSPAPSRAPSPTPVPADLTYVALGDSLLYALPDDCNACTSAAEIFGKQLSADLKKSVDTRNLTMHNSLTSDGLATYLKNGAEIGREPEDVLAAVTAADVVSVTIGFNDIGYSDADRIPLLLDRFEANLDAILKRIRELRGSKNTMLRVTEVYNNGVAATPAADPDGPGTGVSFWKPIIEAQNAVICKLAAKYEGACVDIYHPFNGKTGTSSPAEEGYLGPDGVHPSQLGMDVIAMALRSSGYAPLR